MLENVEKMLLSLLPQWLVALVLRIALGVPFWKSGLTKWDGFGQISDSTLTLFSEDFKLHILGKVIDYPFPVAMAYASGVAELALPLLLALGLLTRFAALGLLGMTFIIQLTVPDGWPIHITWAAMALVVIYFGAGKISVDWLLRKR